MRIRNFISNPVKHIFRNFHKFTDTTVQINSNQSQCRAGGVMMPFACRAFTAPDNGVNCNPVALPEIFHLRSGLDYGTCKFMTLYEGDFCAGMKFTEENMLITSANTGITNFYEYLIA